MSKKSEKKEDELMLPFHLGVILDGNRRWAKEKGLSTREGHKKGLEAAKKIIKWCSKNGVSILTLFVFSTENWNRSKEEISYLMNLFEEFLQEIRSRDFAKEGIQVKVIGTKNKLSSVLKRGIEQLEESTQNNKKMILNIALSYGGRAEIIEAVKNIIKSKIHPDKITEDVVKNNLWTSDVDLIIRTGKEQRISNFLIWQAAYSELYFSKKYLPDFKEVDLKKAIIDFGQRQRRKGK